MKRTITINRRPPRCYQEENCFGLTTSTGKSAHIYINKEINDGRVFLDTLFHELVHAVIGLYQNKIDRRKEENLCRAIAEDAVRRFLKCQRKK